jgi:hypothetical protein
MINKYKKMTNNPLKIHMIQFKIKEGDTAIVPLTPCRERVMKKIRNHYQERKALKMVYIYLRFQGIRKHIINE